jgi:hypothetical protein
MLVRRAGTVVEETGGDSGDDGGERKAGFARDPRER